MDWLTGQNLIATGLVLMGVCGMINLVGATIDRLRKLRKPQEDMVGRMDDIKRKLDTDKRRLDAHDAQLDDLHTGLMAVCAGVQALLEHELHNGNTDEMHQASAEISGWLRERQPYRTMMSVAKDK